MPLICFQIQEEYIVQRYDNGSSPNYQRQEQGYQQQQQHRSREYKTHRQEKQENYNQRSYSATENREVDAPVDTSPIDVVKNVIDRWETKIGGLYILLWKC